MSALTTKYALAYPTSSDTVASLATIVQNLAQRMDLLLGESGQVSSTTGAATTQSFPITLARTYPGNSGAAVPGIVVATVTTVLSQPNTMTYWVTPWTGTATTITGFTLNLQFTNAQTARLVNWRFLPCL